jgi:putative ABC transport system substrate-binding protein
LLTTYPSPVEDGFAATLARPGGTITGLADTPRSQLAPKQLQLFKEAVPGLKRVAVLGAYDFVVDWQNEAANNIGIKLLPVVSHPADPEDSFARVAKLRPDGLYLAQTGTNYGHRKQLGQLAYAARMPSMDTQGSDNVEAGGLMSYAASPDRWRRLAHYIDRIVRGANPGDLPMEMPLKFDLVINLKTAKAIGISIPQSVLLRADRLIE